MKIINIQMAGSQALNSAKPPPRGSQGSEVESAPATSVAADAEPKLQEQRTAELERALERANDLLAGSDHRLEIEVHDPSGRFVTKLVDGDGQVLRQYPAEEFLKVSERFAELRGLLFTSEG